MADLVLETPEGVALRFELAGPGTRLLAATVDGLVLVLGGLAVALFFELLGFRFGTILLASGGVLLLVAYWFGFALLLDGRTPGKTWVGIRVTDAEGFAPRVDQLLLRALFVPLEAVLIVPVPLVWILIAATPRRQRLGDMVAGTLVLRDPPRRSVREPVPELAWSALESHAFPLDPAAVRSLSGRDLGFLRALLTRGDLDPRARQRLHRDAARHYHARVLGAARELDTEEARTFLRELFLLLREVRATRRGGARVTPRPADGGAARGAPRAGGSRPR